MIHNNFYQIIKFVCLGSFIRTPLLIDHTTTTTTTAATTATVTAITPAFGSLTTRPLAMLDEDSELHVTLPAACCHGPLCHLPNYSVHMFRVESHPSASRPDPRQRLRFFPAPRSPQNTHILCCLSFPASRVSVDVLVFRNGNASAKGQGFPNTKGRKERKKNRRHIISMSFTLFCSFFFSSIFMEDGGGGVLEANIFSFACTGFTTAISHNSHVP